LLFPINLTVYKYSLSYSPPLLFPSPCERMGIGIGDRG
jgi:hypothetical protein